MCYLLTNKWIVISACMFILFHILIINIINTTIKITTEKNKQIRVHLSIHLVKK